MDVTLIEAVAALDAGFDAADAPSPDVDGSDRASRPPAERFVQFTVGDTCYAVLQALVAELDRVPTITMVPQTPAWLRGVANLRGDVLSVVDLRAWLGLDPMPAHAGRLLVVRLPDDEVTVGLLVDAVGQIVALEADGIRPPASPLEGPLAPFLRGVAVAGERLVAVVDLDRWLRSPDLRQFEDPKEDSSCEAR